jgi:hypothetical protein
LAELGRVAGVLQAILAVKSKKYTLNQKKKKKLASFFHKL